MAAVSTRDLLLSLGFVPDARVFSNPPGGLSMNFGNFELKASYVLNRNFHPVVMLRGVMVTPRIIAEVECEMLEEVESVEQGIAWVTYCLDQHASGGVFVPAWEVPWLEIGRQYKHLLPWERQMAAYAARPQCWVRKDFARVGLRHLAELLDKASEGTPIMFSFDGEVLKIRVGEEITAMPANGAKWDKAYMLKAERFWGIPKRLMRERVYFEVWGGAVRIENRMYGGAEAVERDYD